MVNIVQLPYFRCNLYMHITKSFCPPPMLTLFLSSIPMLTYSSSTNIQCLHVCLLFLSHLLVNKSLPFIGSCIIYTYAFSIQCTHATQQVSNRPVKLPSCWHICSQYATAVMVQTLLVQLLNGICILKSFFPCAENWLGL